MKEIARVEILDKTCDDCRFELAGCDRRYPNKIECNMLNDRKNWKVEQVPESFSELKKLCREIKTDAKIFFFGDAIKIEKPSLIMYFEDTGIVYINATIFVQSRTPQQMWNIIKSLIGEEK